MTAGAVVIPSAVAIIAMLTFQVNQATPTSDGITVLVLCRTAEVGCTFTFGSFKVSWEVAFGAS